MAKEKDREAWTKIIDLYRDLSYLWDKKHNEHNNRDMRQEGHKMLLELLNTETGKDTTLADFKKKLENMRTTYGRELKKVVASKQTGSGSNEVYVPSLWYYPLFEFLEGTMEPCRPGTDTLNENRGSPGAVNATEQICDKEVPEVSTKSSQSKKQKTSIQNRQEKLLDSAQTLMTQKDEDWEIIGKSIGVQLKDLSTHQQVIAQKLCSDAIFYGKLGKLTDESIITLSPQNTASHSSCIPHRYSNSSNYLYSSGSSMTNSPKPYGHYNTHTPLPSPQLSQHYLIPQSPQASPQHTPQPPNTSNETSQAFPQHTPLPSPQLSQHYLIPQSPQASPQHTPQPPNTSNESSQAFPQHTPLPSPQLSQHYLIPQSPQASPQHTPQPPNTSNETSQAFLQHTPLPSPQLSQHYLIPQSPQAFPQHTPQPLNTSNTEHLNTEFPNCTFETNITKGIGADMRDFLIFKK